MKISGLWVPLVTPMYHGHFDAESAKRLVDSLEAFADGYVAALSSGEGGVLSEDLWRETVSGFSSLTNKPVAASIFLSDVQQIILRSQIAKTIGCAAIVVPTASENADEVVDFFTRLNEESALPVLIYSEAYPIKSIQTLERLDKLENIIGIKESSADESFIKNVLAKKQQQQLRMSILQGMDHKLYLSVGYDGFMVALANIEPQLCKAMFENPTEELQSKILEKFWEYNLGGEWFVTLKALLYERGVLRSAEQVRQMIRV